MAKVEIDVRMPDKLLKSFLQHMRDWEAQHMEESEFMIWIPECAFPGDQMLAIFQSIRPKYSAGATFYPSARGKKQN